MTTVAARVTPGTLICRGSNPPDGVEHVSVACAFAFAGVAVGVDAGVVGGADDGVTAPGSEDAGVDVAPVAACGALPLSGPSSRTTPATRPSTRTATAVTIAGRRQRGPPSSGVVIGWP